MKILLLLADYQVIQLLQRTIQLGKLTLSIEFSNRSLFLNGTCLNNKIYSQILNLQTVHFDIITYYRKENNENQKSSDKIRRTFNQSVDVISIHYVLYTWYICQFASGYFPNVRDLYIYDHVNSIEYDFLLRTIESFPLFKSLTIDDDIPQRKKTNIE